MTISLQVWQFGQQCQSVTGVLVAVVSLCLSLHCRSTSRVWQNATTGLTKHEKKQMTKAGGIVFTDRAAITKTFPCFCPLSELHSITVVSVHGHMSTTNLPAHLCMSAYLATRGTNMVNAHFYVPPSMLPDINQTSCPQVLQDRTIKTFFQQLEPGGSARLVLVLLRLFSDHSCIEPRHFPRLCFPLQQQQWTMCVYNYSIA